MAGRLKKKLSLDATELQEMIARSKKELAQARDELKELGNELKREHMRRMLHPEAVTLSGPAETPRLNPMCRGCLNSCKQSDSVRIIRCARYDPVD